MSKRCSTCSQLYRVKNHFIFSVETTGALPPDQLFLEAVKILTKKARDSIDKIPDA